MVELRKRKAPAQPPVAEKKTKQVHKPAAPAKSAGAAAQKVDQKATQAVPNVDDTIDLDSFGGEIETNDGTKTSLKKLVGQSQSGVVLFTYPKASTPGCE